MTFIPTRLPANRSRRDRYEVDRLIAAACRAGTGSVVTQEFAGASGTAFALERRYAAQTEPGSW